jgi:hypothetical protein
VSGPSSEPSPVGPDSPDPAETEPTDNSTGVAPDLERVQEAEEEAMAREHPEGRCP